MWSSNSLSTFSHFTFSIRVPSNQIALDLSLNWMHAMYLSNIYANAWLLVQTTLCSENSPSSSKWCTVTPFQICLYQPFIYIVTISVFVTLFMNLHQGFSHQKIQFPSFLFLLAIQNDATPWAIISVIVLPSTTSTLSQMKRFDMMYQEVGINTYTTQYSNRTQYNSCKIAEHNNSYNSRM